MTPESPYVCIRKCAVGMVRGVSNSQYIGIGAKSRKAPTQDYVGLNTNYFYTKLTWKASEHGLSAENDTRKYQFLSSVFFAASFSWQTKLAIITCYMMKPYIKGINCALFWEMHWITHSCLIWKRITPYICFYNALL